jgi:hypothetical protein
MAPICDLQAGAVSLANGMLTCNEEPASEFTGPFLEITGSSVSTGVSVNGYQGTIALTGVSISIATGSPFLIEESTVTVLVEGSNTATTTSADAAGIACASSSNVTITSIAGGVLQVTGGSKAVGIGARNGKCASIDLVNASTAASGATGIGTDASGIDESVISAVNSIRIFGSNVTARGASQDGNEAGPGIGNGPTRLHTSSVREILISDSIVMATSEASGSGDAAAGMGNPLGAMESSTIGSIVIVDSYVIANSSTVKSNAGPGIGAKSPSTKTSTIGMIVIFRSHVTGLARGGTNGEVGPGIGTGSTTTNTSGVGGVLVFNSKVTGISETPKGSAGFGIEGEEITITGSTITVSSSIKSPAIGTGTRGGGLTFIGDNVVNSSSSSAGPAVQASSIRFLNASVVFIAESMPALNTTTTTVDFCDLVIFYRTTTNNFTENLSLLFNPFLHIGHLDIQTYESGTLCIAKDEEERCFAQYRRGLLSSVVSTFGMGEHVLSGVLDHHHGVLQAEDGISVVNISSSYTYIPVVKFTFRPTMIWKATQSIGNSLSFRQSLMVVDSSGEAPTADLFFQTDRFMESTSETTSAAIVQSVAATSSGRFVTTARFHESASLASTWEGFFIQVPSDRGNNECVAIDLQNAFTTLCDPRPEKRTNDALISGGQE